MRALAGLLAVSALSTLGSSALAADVVLETRAVPDRVEVGETFRVQLTALSADSANSPSSPRLEVPPGFTVHGPSIGTQRQISIVQGRMSQLQGFTATWTLQAQRPGRYSIGPASVATQSGRVQDRKLSIEVVAQGQGGRKPRARRGFPFDPFDLFDNPGRGLFDDPFGDPFDNDPQALLDALPPYPAELKLSQAEDPTAFLRTQIQPKNAVVGEQVTLTLYAYGGRGPFRENSIGERMYRVPVGDDIWHAIKVREIALFPIRTGTLEIGGMTMAFDGPGYFGRSRKGLERTSKIVSVNVSEPPVKGRPAGYNIGDVGSFQLRAQVEPRDVVAGDAVSVVVKLSGKGNLPLKLRTPETQGVEWLEPRVSGELEPQGHWMGGERTFSYVVTLNKPGNVDLGEISLPYWDPRRDTYDTARASLGYVHVSQNPNGTANNPAKHDDPARPHFEPRTQLSKLSPPTPPLSDRPWFWLALGCFPLSAMLSSGAVRLGSQVRQRLKQRQASPEARVKDALKAARDALQKQKPNAALQSAEKALFLAIEIALGLRARGVLQSELALRLEAAGLTQELADKIVQWLENNEALRFTAPLSGVEQQGAVDERVEKQVEQAAQLSKQVRAERSKRGKN